MPRHPPLSCHLSPNHISSMTPFVDEWSLPYPTTTQGASLGPEMNLGPFFYFFILFHHPMTTKKGPRRGPRSKFFFCFFIHCTNFLLLQPPGDMPHQHIHFDVLMCATSPPPSCHINMSILMHWRVPHHHHCHPGGCSNSSSSKGRDMTRLGSWYVFFFFIFSFFFFILLSLLAQTTYKLSFRPSVHIFLIFSFHFLGFH